MPLLDVSEVLDDPIFNEQLTVYRRVQTVGANGRAVITPTLIVPNPLGVIMPKDSVIGGNALQREADYQYRGAALLVYTRFRLRGPSTNEAEDTEWQPDIVVWNHDPYVVTLLNDYSQYGEGYVQAELSSMASVDLPPAEEGA